jgi:hypothetical protein
MARTGQRGFRRGSQQAPNRLRRAPWFTDSLARVWTTPTGLLPAKDPAGGTDHTRSITDERGETDTGQSIGHGGTTTDDRGVTDSAPTVSGVGHTQSITDERGQTDTRALDQGKALSDARGMVDTATDTFTPGGTNHTASFTDSTGLTDTGQSYGRTGSTTDDRGSTDTASDVLDTGTDWVESFTDSRGETDTGYQYGLEAATTDSRGATDTATHTVGTVTLAVSITDSRGATDAGQVRGREGLTTDSRGASDTATPVVNTNPSTNYVRTPNDSVGLTDTVLAVREVTITDNVGLVEYPAVGDISVSESLEDGRGATDGAVYSRVESPIDDRGVTDSIVQETGRTLSDLAARTDTADVGVGKAPADVQGLTDSAEWVLTPFGETDIQAVFVDEAPRTDTVTLSHGQDSTDDTGLTDSLLTEVSSPQTYTVDITDDTIWYDVLDPELGVTFVDILTLTDTLTAIVGPEIGVYYRISDTSLPDPFVQIRDLGGRGGSGRWMRGVAQSTQPALLLEAPSVTWPLGRVVVSRDAQLFERWDDAIIDPKGYRVLPDSWQYQVLIDAGYALEGAPT